MFKISFTSEKEIQITEQYVLRTYSTYRSLPKIADILIEVILAYAVNKTAIVYDNLLVQLRNHIAILKH